MGICYLNEYKGNGMANKIKAKTELSKKFIEIAYGAVKEYADRNELSQGMLSNILGGKITGESGGAKSIAIFECLKRDGIYTDEFFPWQKEYKARETTQKSA